MTGTTSFHIHLFNLFNQLHLVPRELLEYEVAYETIETKTFNNFSGVIMSFVFKRHVEYQITNSFLQVGNCILFSLISNDMYNIILDFGADLDSNGCWIHDIVL